MKRDKLKNSLIEQLKEMPILQIALKKVGMSRASYYRWRKDSKFSKEIDNAMAEGRELITDLSENQLISLIRDRNFPALQLWLKAHSPRYSNKVELTGNLNIKEEPLSPEQEELVKKALELAGLLESKQAKQNNEQDVSKPTQ